MKLSINKFSQWLKGQFSIDDRALGATRIALGLIVLTDLCLRSMALTAHYTQHGVLPRSFIFNSHQNSFYISFHLANDHLYFQMIMFLFHGIIALIYTLGLGGKMIQIMMWIMCVSLQNRNIFILQGGDQLLRLFLLWTIWLPMNDKYTLQSSIKKDHTTSYSTSTFILIIQVCALYFFSAAHKNDFVWWGDHSATTYALMLDSFVTPLGKMLLTFPKVCQFLTCFVYLLEWLAPLFILINKQTRYLAIALLVLLHLGFSLSLEIGLFPYINYTSLIILLPPKFWNQIDQSRVFRCLSKIQIIQYFKIMPFNQEFKLKRMKKILDIPLLCLFILSITWSYLATPLNTRQLKLPMLLTQIGWSLRIDQVWDMFAPYPSREDGYYVMEGTLQNKHKVDVWNLNKIPPSYDPPQLISKTYRSQRWRKFLRNLISNEWSNLRPSLAYFLCKRWNRNPRYKMDQLKKLKITFMSQTSLAPFKEEHIKPKVFFETFCFP